MSIGSLGFASIGPGATAAQPKSDADRAQHDAAAQQSLTHNNLKAEQAAGIGQADGEEHETEDRDADGRRPWELPPKKKDAVADTTASDEPPPHRKDPSGQCGNILDLSG